jgi:hypothetical protein
MPVQVDMFGVTSVKAKDIKSRFANQVLGDTEWYRLTEEFQQYLSGVIE